MAEIPRMELTEAGYQLYGKIQTGQATLNISRVVIGTGFLNDNETIFDLAALKNEIDVTTQILKNEIVGNGQTKLSFRITAATEDFPLREIGVTAIDPDNGEILYCACNLGNNAEYVVVYGGILPVTTEADIYFAIGVGSIKVEFARDTAAVPYKEFEEHTSDKENPHGVTAAQVFPDNSTVLENITAENITGFKAAANEKHTHGNKSVLDKITDVLVEKWNSAVSHITNRANPHGVTKSQVGLGNVTNESKKTMFNSPEFTGIPKAPTASAGTSTIQIATTEFVMSAIATLAKTVIDGTYAIYLFNKDNYDTVNSLGRKITLSQYEDGGISSLPPKWIDDNVVLPKATNAPVISGVTITSNDDETICYEMLLYSNGEIWSRQAVLWWYLGGATGTYGEWQNNEWVNDYVAPDYFKNNI